MKRLPPELQYAGVYATSQQLGFTHSRTEEEIAASLATLSAYDCMVMIGRLSATLFVDGSWQSPAGQLRLITWLAAFDDEWYRRLLGVVRQGMIAVFPQQLAHLARLVARHAADRPSEDFRTDDHRRAFLEVLFGVSDLFYDSGLDLRDRDDRLRWALRHTGIGHRAERLTLWSTYFEVFCRIWPSLHGEGMPDADAAFERYTGMTIQRFMAAGLAFSSAFAAQQHDRPGRGSLVPTEYFAKTIMPERDWRAFLDVCGTSLESLRDRLADEERAWGHTTFGALAYEKTPLLQDHDGNVFLISLESLERRVTEGVLHILAEGAVDEGGEREDFTAPFGRAFQQWAEACFQRANEHVLDPPQIFADLPYGTKGQSKQTPDVVLRYPRVIVVAEVVSGPLHAATLTHGDLDCFDSDMKKLIEKKSRQLTKRVDEMLNGDTRRLGLDADGVSSIWPVIITATTFPHRPEIGPVVRRRLKREALLGHRLLRPLSIVSAEELAAAEGAMEEGTPFVQLLSEWKAAAATGDHPFRNHLIFREHEQRRRPAQHHQDMYREACEAMIGEVLDAEQLDDAFGRDHPNNA